MSNRKTTSKILEYCYMQVEFKYKKKIQENFSSVNLLELSFWQYSCSSKSISIFLFSLLSFLLVWAEELCFNYTNLHPPNFKNWKTNILSTEKLSCMWNIQTSRNIVKNLLITSKRYTLIVDSRDKDKTRTEVFMYLSSKPI